MRLYFYGYFRNWSNHSNFYYASKHTGFKPNVRRTEGTYTKYSSIDDKLDTFHQWFALLKFGHGRCTANAAREIREGYITREEGVALVHKYDAEFLSYILKSFLITQIYLKMNFGILLRDGVITTYGQKKTMNG